MASLNELIRRGKVRPRAAVESPIRVITETALSGPQRHISGTRIHLSSAEEREQSVALAQPHRQDLRIGDDIVATAADRRWASALGRFCLAHKPRPLGEHMYDTGVQYGIVVLEWKRSVGFEVKEGADAGYDMLTEQQKEARRELACKRKGEADDLLWSACCKPLMMERLCYDDLDIGGAERPILVDGLVVLAKKWHYWPRSEMHGT